jgi:hypothetical protein
MSCKTSALAGRLYGVKLVCRTWEQPRSSYYVARQAQGQPVRSFPAGKRGPKTPLSDAALLELIRADLNTSSFQAEGHRKVWARLRVRDGVKVGRRRVLRLMRENNLLPPYRGRRGNSRLTRGKSSPRRPTSCGAPTAPGSLPQRRGGVDLRGCRALERRVRGLACL